jgi:predicted ATPase
MWSKGFAAEETQAAFARVRELAALCGNAAERFNEYNGRWVRSYTRGELLAARDTAEAFLREAEAEDRAMEAGAARRVLGLTCLSQGEFAAARSHLERTLHDYDAERDRESHFRFSVDTGSAAAAYVALAAWHLGDVDCAASMMDRAVAGALEIGHIPTIVNVHAFKTRLDVRRDDPKAALHSIEVQVSLARAHAMSLYVVFGNVIASWARAREIGGAEGAKDFRRALAVYMDQGAKADAPYFHGLLGKFVAQSGDPAGALALVDEGLRLADETGEHWSDPELYRFRGEVLQAAGPTATERAGQAFEAAIAIARRQESRSFGLRAALALAKLRQSSNRRADAAAALTPALQRLSPTPAMPEIVEASALLAALNAPLLLT